MRSFLLLSLVAFTFLPAFGQSVGSSIKVVTVYSQNELFYLRSWPFDSEFPTLRGETKVFSKNSPTPIYSFSRGFDSVDDESNNLVISNDGEVVLFLISYDADEEKDGLKSVSIYKHGKLIQNYSLSELTGCDLKNERCEIEYSNYDEVVDKEKSNWGSAKYKKVFKAGVDAKEKFLSDFAVFTNDDIVYITDSKTIVHRISLKDGKHISSTPFSEAYPSIKDKGRFNKVTLQRLTAPMFLDFPTLQTGADAALSLSKILNMVPTKNYGPDADKYKVYSFKINGYLSRDGKFEPDQIEWFDPLPEEAIRNFFAATRFTAKDIPPSIAKWWVDDYFYFRKANAQIAIREKKEELEKQKAERAKRMTAESVNGRYIPKDIGEAFIELDKELPAISRKEMTALKSRKDMIAYHHGLGTWIRNNWGLWGGSRLQKYFLDKKIGHPDDMSSVILHFYWDWLQGNKETWKVWDKNPTSIFDDK